MPSSNDNEGADLLHTLLSAGTASGLTDGQLLERFATRSGHASEAAFEALVARHGPMVRRTCRAVLGDVHDAEDACQATFVILARQGASLWVRDSLGPWLHRVACRAAVRARRTAIRRMQVEQCAAARAARSADPEQSSDELASLVHEELDCLPDRLRTVIVLCDLEGRTHEAAARHLNCPVGTVKSRLARGRARLQRRLNRRGIAPTVVTPWLAFTAGHQGAATAVSLESSSVLTSAVIKSIATGAAPATVLALAQGVLRAMRLVHLKTASMRIAVASALAFGLVATAGSWAQQRTPEERLAVENPPKTPPKAVAPDPYSWRREDVYEPPDFARYFPDDPRGGLALDTLWADEERIKRPAGEVLATVRQGLRRTEKPRDEILKWVGETYIWNAPRQSPDAIEILYHAADYRGPMAQHWGESPSIYCGFMRVEPRTSAMLHALVDWCMHVENGTDWHWAAWCAKGRREAMASYIKPYLASADEATRDRALALQKMVTDAPDAATAYATWLTKVTRVRSAQHLPGIRQDLLTGDSAARKQALDRIWPERLNLIMDESFVAAFRACAVDEDPAVRRQLTRSLSACCFSQDRALADGVVDALLKLTRDPNPKVRYDALYQGLTPLPLVRREEVTRRLVEMALFDSHPGITQRVAWAVQQDRDRAAAALDEHLHSGDPKRVEAARAAYRTLLGRPAPGVGKSDPETRKGYVRAIQDLHAHLGRVYPSFGIKEIDWAQVGRDLLPRAEALETEVEFGQLVEELVARLEDSHATVLEGSATPPWPEMPEWDPWLACLLDDRDRPVIYSVSPHTAAWRAGVRPGMTVLSVNGVSAAEAMARWMREQRRFIGYSSERYLKYDAVRFFHRQPKRDDRVSFVLEDLEGRRKNVDLSAEVRGWFIPRLPVARDGIDDGGADIQWLRLDNGLGYVYVRRMQEGLETALDQAFYSLGDIKGLILDLRGNSGGGFDASTAFQNFDLASDTHQPRYTGPIALLLDERCISAGEGWASWFIARKRARTFGATTAGASARKEIYTLTNGLYKVQIPVKAYTGFLDRPIERRGLEPDVPVRYRAVDLSQGRDTVVEAAAAWLLQGGGK